MRNRRSFIASFLFCLFAFVQIVDVFHHAHEEEAELCSVSDTHLCAPHHEAEICDLCTVLHGSFDLKLSFELEQYDVPRDTYSREGDATFLSESKDIVKGRGPPTNV